ncbi:MAG: dihydroorotase family protein [Armatimonadota bacterium]|nr:dihydroorotase family protein [Armatimonadota bacterium]MDR5702727.1 dihydroorotase family protein [Armatimonadota bacterium]MDR7434867.1 dihydroorotase family protein [Armatimonadota bacterium]
MDLVIKGAKIVTPAGLLEGEIYVQEGKIAGIGKLGLSAKEVIDAGGLLAMPGMVDAHVHFMDPGATEREDFITGSSAAAVGGVTTVIEHTHAMPVRTAQFLQEKARYLGPRSLVDYGLAAHVWPEDIEHIQEVWEAGALFLKAFTCTTHGVPGLTPSDLLRLFQKIFSFNGVCLVHCEDEWITMEAERRLKKLGRKDGMVIPEWRNREAELVAVNTVALLARLTGARVVIAHVSHPAVLDLIRRERVLGANLWAESCPQYFYLLEEEVQEKGAYRKFTPPARNRSVEDMEEMWHRLARGEISYIATDHAPATKAQKEEGDIWSVHFGLPGVETTLSLMLNGVAEGYLSLPRLVEAVCEMPARVYGLYPKKGTLQPGADADIVLVDPQAERILTDSEIVSKAGWTPYAGRRIKGKPVMTFLRGKLIARDGKVTADPGIGHFLTRSAPRM